MIFVRLRPAPLAVLECKLRFCGNVCREDLSFT